MPKSSDNKRRPLNEDLAKSLGKKTPLTADIKATPPPPPPPKEKD